MYKMLKLKNTASGHIAFIEHDDRHTTLTIYNKDNYRIAYHMIAHKHCGIEKAFLFAGVTLGKYSQDISEWTQMLSLESNNGD